MYMGRIATVNMESYIISLWVLDSEMLYAYS